MTTNPHRLALAKEAVKRACDDVGTHRMNFGTSCALATLDLITERGGTLPPEPGKPMTNPLTLKQAEEADRRASHQTVYKTDRDYRLAVALAMAEVMADPDFPPPEPVDGDLLAVRKIAAEWQPAWKVAYLNGSSDAEPVMDMGVIAYRAGRASAFANRPSDEALLREARHAVGKLRGISLDIQLETVVRVVLAALESAELSRLRGEVERLTAELDEATKYAGDLDDWNNSNRAARESAETTLAEHQRTVADHYGEVLDRAEAAESALAAKDEAIAELVAGLEFISTSYQVNHTSKWCRDFAAQLVKKWGMG